MYHWAYEVYCQHSNMMTEYSSIPLTVYISHLVLFHAVLNDRWTYIHMYWIRKLHIRIYNNCDNRDESNLCNVNIF